MQLALKHGAKVIFNDNPDSYIISRTESNWKNLLLQRGRWSGDANIMWRFNMNFYLTAISTWTTSIAIIGLILSISTNYLNLMLWLEYSLFIILLFKISLEIKLYRLGMIKFQQPVKYIDFIIWAIIHPFYISIMGLFSFFNFKWRGKSVI